MQLPGLCLDTPSPLPPVVTQVCGLLSHETLSHVTQLCLLSRAMSRVMGAGWCVMQHGMVPAWSYGLLSQASPDQPWLTGPLLLLHRRC